MEEEIRVEGEKIIDLDAVGKAHIKRSFIIRNMTDHDMTLTSENPFKVYLKEETDQIMNVKFVDQDENELRYDLIRDGGYTTLKGYIEDQVIGGGHRYMVTFVYDYGSFAHKFGRVWHVVEKFTFMRRLPSQRIYVKYLLPRLGSKWRFWEGFEAEGRINGQDIPCETEGGRKSFSHQFILPTGSVKIVKISYGLNVRPKLQALLTGFVAVLIERIFIYFLNRAGIPL